MGPGTRRTGGAWWRRVRREDFLATTTTMMATVVVVCGWGWVVFVCATVQYPVSGLTVPLPLLLFRLLLLLRFFFFLSHFLRAPSPFSHFTVSCLTQYSLYLSSFQEVFPACHRWLTRRTLVLFCHAFALRLDASIFSHFLVRRAHNASLLCDSPFDTREKAWE